MDTKLTVNFAAVSARLGGALRHLSSCHGRVKEAYEVVEDAKHQVTDKEVEQANAEEGVTNLLVEFEQTKTEWLRE